MHRWHIGGADRVTGEIRTLEVRAATEAGARRMAGNDGVVVAWVHQDERQRCHRGGGVTVVVRAFLWVTVIVFVAFGDLSIAMWLSVENDAQSVMHQILAAIYLLTGFASWITAIVLTDALRRIPNGH